MGSSVHPWLVLFVVLLGNVSLAASPEDPMSVAAARIDAAVAGDAIDSPTQIVVAYFTPADREPARDHLARIRRIVEETADFYHGELARHGFDGRACNLLRNDAGEVEVIDVVGRDNDSDYGKSDGKKVRDETIKVLERRGIDANQSVLLLFCNLMDYDPVESTIKHHSPYYGGGGHLSGTAWQCDSEILDPLRLADMTPITDGEYGRITIGRHNSIFIGGVIHELGHALSLPHCRERSDEAPRGTALMGSGNRTYRQEVRGEGRGTFLTRAHALRLAALPAMQSRVPASVRRRARSRWSELQIVSPQPFVLQIKGTVESTTPVHGVVAYFDRAGGGDYDATTATSIPDSDGRFEMTSDSLRPGASGELRLVACHVNGTTTQRKFRYGVQPDGTFDLNAIRLEWELGEMVDELRGSDVAAAAMKLKSLAKDDAQLAAIGQRVLDRFTDAAEPLSVSLDSVSVDSVDDSVREIQLSSVRPESAKVGWLQPTYNVVPENSRLLSVDGDYFAHGIYAHAPAEHRYRIDGDWKRLTGRCGIQAGHSGKVNFRLYGDEQLIWQVDGVTAAASVPFDVDVSDVDWLELIVDDGGNGNGADWGVWISPLLSR